MKNLCLILAVWLALGLRAQPKDTAYVNARISEAKKIYAEGDYLRVIPVLDEATAVSIRLGYEKGRAAALNILGLVYKNTGDTPKAMESLLQSLTIREQIRDREGVANTCNNLALIYQNTGDADKAIAYTQRALAIQKELNNTARIPNSYINLGSIYYELRNDPRKALHYFELALDQFRRNKDDHGAGMAYGNLGVVYRDLKEYDKAKDYYERSEEIFSRLGEKAGLATALLNIGGIYLSLEKWDESLKYNLECNRIAREVGSIEDLMRSDKIISALYQDKGDHKTALKYYKEYIALRDSVTNEENTKKTVRLEMNYEFGKKEAAARLEQEKKEAVAAAERKKQRIIIYSVCGALLMVAAFAIFAYRSFRQKQKANIEITRQKNIIEEKQKEILDSIRYARRIQAALLTSERYIGQSLERLGRSGSAAD